MLSYDSFRGSKESLKSRQANSNLSGYSSLPIEYRVPDADESSLIQTINRLNPIVIVDESHHAKSPLSLDMLKNFNPSPVLELTATPRPSSNVISLVTAVELKCEHMVKLPVIVRNLNDRSSVMAHAIELRRRPEEAATSAVRYIRPIVLFQAQPRVGNESDTFDKIRAEMIKLKIPPEQIAIRTADINELKGVDLMSRDCPIRFIITVNALREGWDCPFAYVLASLANKTSAVDVEQIVGRILRLPHSSPNADQNLNETPSANLTLEFNPIEEETFAVADIRSEETTSSVDEMLSAATALGRQYEEQSSMPELTGGIGVKRFKVRPQFADDIERLRLPQFVFETRAGDWTGVTQSMFDGTVLLEKENPELGFELLRADRLDLNDVNEEIYKIDASADGIERRKASIEEQRRIVELSMSSGEQLRRGRQAIIERLRSKNSLADADIFAYVDRLIDNQNEEGLERLKKFPWACADYVMKKVDDSIEEHRRKKFYELLATERIGRRGSDVNGRRARAIDTSISWFSTTKKNFSTA